MTTASGFTCEALNLNWSRGDVAVWSLLDGTVRVSPDALEFSNADAGRSLHLRPHRAFDIPVNVFLLTLGGKKILVDAGGGRWVSPDLGGTPEALRRLGYSCADIDVILMTHLHPDHVTGMIDETGAAVYSRAEIVVHEREMDFWFRSSRSAMAGRARRNAALAERAFAPYLDRIRQIRNGDKSVPGLVSKDLPGHTPGHTGWCLTVLGERFHFCGDIVHAAEPQLRLPDTAIMFDVDKNACRETRRNLLPALVDRHAIIAGAHLPQGGIGTLARDGDGFRFAPLQEGRSLR